MNAHLVAIEAALGNDKLAETIGEQLAAELRLRRNSKERFNLTNGDKTARGLARTLFRIIADEMTQAD